MQQKILPSGTIPIFADEVMVSFVVKKDESGKEKDSAIRLSFIDAMRKTVISEVVLSPITAHALVHIIEGTLKKMKSGKVPEQKDETTYIG